MGRETAEQRRQRFRAEERAAIRAAITPDIRDVVTRVGREDEHPFVAGFRVTLKASARRTFEVDEGRIYQQALADWYEECGHKVLAMSMLFGIGAGRGSTRYGVVTEGTI